jgi:glycerate kinase
MKKDKIILIPDSFKGTMTSLEVCQTMEHSIKGFIPDAHIISIPIADGGEGTIDALQSAVGGKRITLTVQGPVGAPVKASYVLLKNNIAVIEMAEAAGLPLMGERLDVLRATTFGVGELISDALKHHPDEVIIALGGSATNDGGTGACAALGATFLDRSGNAFVPVGETLNKIARIDLSELEPSVKKTKITIMSDINNPLCGKEGAAYVFAPQKGANEEEVELLDQGLAHLAACIKNDLGIDILHVPGAGAAGGMGGGLYALLDAKIKMGIEVILDAVGFDEHLPETAMVFTGEGKIDNQSSRGKVISGIAKRTKDLNIPLIAVVGDIDDDIEGMYEAGVSAIVSINRVAKSYQEIKHRSQSDLALTMDEIMRVLSLGSTFPLMTQRGT